MTIQAYQTLYESSIAYGMRKALQAEQSKAEKYLQLQNLEKRILDKENEVKDLERRIWDMLDQERQDNAEKTEDHKREMAALFADNQSIVKQISDTLNMTNKVDGD